VQNTKHAYLVLDLVNSDAGKRREYKLAGACDTAGASPIRRSVERREAFDDYLGYSAADSGLSPAM
jgi:hypothetical protein